MSWVPLLVLHPHPLPIFSLYVSIPDPPSSRRSLWERRSLVAIHDRTSQSSRRRRSQDLLVGRMSPPRWFRWTSQVEPGIAPYQIHDWWTRVFQVSLFSLHLFCSAFLSSDIAYLAHSLRSLACTDDRYGFRKLIENRSLAIIQPDVMWLGGLTELIKVASWVSPPLSRLLYELHIPFHCISPILSPYSSHIAKDLSLLPSILRSTFWPMTSSAPSITC